MAEHLDSGRAAEQLARTRLEANGLVFIASNYRCRCGELDLVMTESGLLVIVEVRYRRHTGIMHPTQSIGPGKLRRIVQATEHFVQRHGHWRDRAIRFDIVGLHGPLENAAMNWIRDAFTIDDLWG